MITITTKWADNFTESEKRKTQGAIGMLQGILSNPEFYEAIRQHKFTQTEQPTKIIAEYLERQFSQMYLSLSMYRTLSPWSSVMAYHKDGTIFLNRWKFTKNTAQQVAGTIAHEFLHQIGFEHSFRDTPDRSDSVPYAVGRMVSKWGK